MTDDRTMDDVYDSLLLMVRQALGCDSRTVPSDFGVSSKNTQNNKRQVTGMTITIKHKYRRTPATARQNRKFSCGRVRVTERDLSVWRTGPLPGTGKQTYLLVDPTSVAFLEGWLAELARDARAYRDDTYMAMLAEEERKNREEAARRRIAAEEAKARSQQREQEQRERQERQERERQSAPVPSRGRAMRRLWEPLLRFLSDEFWQKVVVAVLIVILYIWLLV